MKKILGIVAAVLFVASPLFAVDPTITYYLGLGGNNGGEGWTTGPKPAFDTTGVQETGVYDASGKSVITWSVRAAAEGAKESGGYSYAIGGAANLVWDLKLKGPDGVLVGDAGSVYGSPFGLGDGSTPGFYSNIQNGTTRDADWYSLEAAAFPWVFETTTPGGTKGRLFDAIANNGPNMAQWTYPNPTGYKPGTTTATTAKSGTLMGQGAGYKSFDPDADTERGGVGIATAGTNECAQNIGQLPIAEGQINISGLPGGTYTLELVPGKGNNALWWATDYICSSIPEDNPGAFAVAALTVGATMQFSIPVTNGDLVVNIAPAEAVAAGAQWSVDAGGTWNNSGATLSLAAGNYTVTFKDVAGWAKPADVGAVVAQGATTTVGPDASTTYAAIPAPVLTAAASVKTHTYEGSTVDAGIALNLVDTATTEPRTGGPSQLVLTYDVNIAATGITVVPTGATLDGISVVDNMLTINLSGSVNKTCVSVAVSGVTAAAGSQPAASTVKVLALRGDVNGDGAVQNADLSLVKARSSGDPLPPDSPNFKFDINLDGQVQNADLSLVKSLSSGDDPIVCPY